MKDRTVFVLVPLAGYAGLWISGSLLFLVYFGAFGVPTDLGYTFMIQSIPAPLAIATVPLCSFVSFFITTKIVTRRLNHSLGAASAFQLGVASLLVTVVLDLVTTVAYERMDITVFPVDFMYSFAWLVIVPSVFLAGHGWHQRPGRWPSGGHGPASVAPT